MSASLLSLIPELQEPARALVDACGAAGLHPRVTSTLRTHAEQSRLYRRYLQGLQCLPVAPPGTSAHEYGYAFDLVTTPIDALVDVGATWQEWGGVWGGAFNDPVHFEYPGFKQPPSDDQNVIAQAAQWFSDLPWWSTFFLPMATTMGPNYAAQWLRDRGFIK